MKYVFVGDTHGDLDFAEQAALLAREHKATMIQAGDWGYLWPGNDKLSDLSDMLVGLGVTMRFIDGNHDDHPRLKKLHGTHQNGVEIAKRVIYQPRGSVLVDEAGTRFLFLGGAPSIDRAFRTPGRSWWPEEVIADAERDLAKSAKGPIHAIVTHDAPAFPPGFSPKGSPGYQHDQDRSLKIVDAVVRHHRPELLVHGHWHARYDRTHAIGTKIVGLDCNNARLEDATLLWSRKTTAL